MKINLLPGWAEINGCFKSYSGSKEWEIEVKVNRTKIKINFSERAKGALSIASFAGINTEGEGAWFTRYNLMEVLEILEENSQTNRRKSNES
jgi:hypothetical protein